MEDLISLNTNSEILVVPRGRKGLAPMRIDFKDVKKAYDRIDEIRRCTPITASDLITDFIIGMMRLSKVISLVELELREAHTELKESQSLALLDRVEAVLLEKKIKSSADTREAVLYLDADVKGARNRYDMLNVINSYLRDTYTGLENAYNGAKKILDVYLKTPMSMSAGDGE